MRRLAVALGKRLTGLIAVLLIMSILAFGLVSLIPGDPARFAAGPLARPDQVEQLRHEFGLDQPIVRQYLNFLGNSLRGNLGRSIRTGHSVNYDLAAYAPVTFELMFFSIFIMTCGGVILGIVLGAASSGWSYSAANVLSLVGISTPPFLIAILFQLFFFAKLNWLPAVGQLSSSLIPIGGPTGSVVLDAILHGNTVVALDALRHLVLPSLALTIGPLAGISRMVRSGLRDALHEQFVRTAYLHGLPRWRVVLFHALPVALLPPLSLLGLQVGSLIAWSVVIEIVFGLPGLGRYLTDSIAAQDIQAIVSTVLVIGVIFVVVNAVIDVLQIILDPRLR